MKILVGRTNRDVLLSALRLVGNAEGTSIEEFENRRIEIPEIDLMSIHDPRPSLFIFSGQVTQDSISLKAIGERISDRPEDTTVAVRYPELAEHLREHEIHADIVPLHSTVESFSEAVSSFLEEPATWRTILFGAKTEWTHQVSERLVQEGFDIEDLTVTLCDSRLRALLLGGAFDLVALGSVSEVDALEGVASLTIERLGKVSRILALSNEIRLHLSRRSIPTDFLASER